MNFYCWPKNIGRATACPLPSRFPCWRIFKIKNWRLCKNTKHLYSRGRKRLR